MRRNLFWLNDEQWERIEPRLPTDVRGVERADHRRVISGIIRVLKSGRRWCDCPPEYGPPTTIYNRFVRWGRFCHERSKKRAAADLAASQISDEKLAWLKTTLSGKTEQVRQEIRLALQSQGFSKNSFNRIGL